MQDLKIGIAGLGAASTLVLPYFERVPGVTLAAAADLRDDARAEFSATYGWPAFDDVAALCASPAVDAVWIETPNHLHCEHALLAARAGKHIICAKPLAISLFECDQMISAARGANVRLLQGHSKIFDPPIQAIRDVVASGRLGAVMQINSWLFNDWLQRPRLKAELDPALGGGLIYRQAPHLVDICNFIIGRPAQSVRANAAGWDPNFDTDGNITASITYDGGATANFLIDAHGFFDVTELTFGIDGIGRQRDAASERGRPRRTGPLTEEEKYGRAFRETPPAARRQGDKMPFFGLTIVSCEKGAIRQSPDGIYVYTAEGRDEIQTPPYLGRAAELFELRDALAEARDVHPNGAWGKATLEICLAIRDSSCSGRAVPLQHQDGILTPFPS